MFRSKCEKFLVENIMVQEYLDLKNRINSAKKILVFGARIVAREVASVLEAKPLAIHIDAFIVSDLSGNPDIFMGRKVMDIDECCKLHSKETLILVACMDKNISSIENCLSECGFDNYIFISFESDIWNELRMEYFKYHFQNRINNIYFIDDLPACENDDEIEKRIAVFKAHSHVDKIIDKQVLNKWEIPIQVGADLTEKTICTIKDNSGKNISNKNSSYCELTGLYWIWNNYNCEYKGLSHYRRMFNLTESQIKGIMYSQMDVVVTTPILNFPSVMDVYYEDHIKQDWDIMTEAIRLLYPQYIESTQKIANGNYYFAYNMMIAKEEIFNDYCKWLFDILDYCREHCRRRNDKYQARYLGFLAERMMTIYLDYHQYDYKVAVVRKRFTP